MFGFGKKQESYWSIIKLGVKKFVETEGNGEGIINLIFGIFIFIIISAICVPVTFAYIIKFCYPNCDIMMPWYGAFAFFTVGVLYFYLCATKVANIMAKRKKAESKLKNGKSHT